MSSVIVTKNDSSCQISGSTFPFRGDIRAAGGVWDPSTKSWTAPLSADLSFLTVTVTKNDFTVQLSGGTFPYKEAIKAAGGLWDPSTKTWTLPLSADLSFLSPVAPAEPLAPVKRPFWLCCDKAHVISYKLKMHSCTQCGRDYEHIFKNGRLYTGD
jgi:hypothetical protein